MKEADSLDIGTRLSVWDLLVEAAYLLDEDRLEDWLDCFTEDAVYRVLSRENEMRSLPLPLLQCENKDMMRDRVLALRRANVFNIHRDRHVVGLARFAADATDGIVIAN